MNVFNRLVIQLQEQVKQEPNNTYLMNDLAIALMETNNYEEAFVLFKKAADIHPNVQSLNNLAYFYYTEEEPLEKGCWRI
ncbi:tetratricopeptide repeat protein [Peribacillus butanolivorans]|uniref:tetratricopeptide repeat protein n=1 Tax=Peribacillus butanolivorans TaxID=421767 RepID=UPI00381D4CF4